MDKQMATSLNQILVGCYADLHRSIDLARGHRSDQDFRTYCRVAAGALGHMLLDLMDPLYNEYPDLAPKFLLQSEDNDLDLATFSSNEELNAISASNDIDAETRNEERLSGLLTHVIAKLRSAAELVANEACHANMNHANVNHLLQEVQCALSRVLEVKALVPDGQATRCAGDSSDR